MELSDLKGVGPARVEALRAVGIYSLRDLLYTLPVRYEDHDTVFPCNTQSSMPVMVDAVIQDAPRISYFRGLSRVTCLLKDQSGTLPACWFNEPWIYRQLRSGQSVRLFGRIDRHGGRRTLQNPRLITDHGWVPVYRTIHGIPAKTFREYIRQALERMAECCGESLPEALRQEYGLVPLAFALRQAHFPDSMDTLSAARRRLSFENMLMYLAYVTMVGVARKEGIPFSGCRDFCGDFWNSMPFPPTKAQKRVLTEIAEDLENGKAMARLVQGDVGCGKTAIAFGAIFLAARSGYQACMMAPTEILARQHYENALRTLEPLGIRCCLLTGSTRAAERRKILEMLQTGASQAVFGTHALISRDVSYARLGLVITDEQHRFGVNQRTSLQMKGTVEEVSPHVLVMSATPIPRTLALILYGDLDISVVDELPAGRKPVSTRLVPEHKRPALYRFLRQQVAEGAQAYVVCPLVEDSETLEDVRSARSVYDQLSRNELAGLRLGLTWGTQKSDEKAKILDGFLNGTFDVLVATTVIEVGVNNPRATVMIIENAERYGLSQLHQLRGRVGRGNRESWCFLLSEETERLKTLCETNDGFEVSRKDLELRGPGDLIGTRQSGDLPGNGMIFGDVRLLEEASACIRNLHRDESKADMLQAVEAQALHILGESSRSIALN